MLGARLTRAAPGPALGLTNQLPLTRGRGRYHEHYRSYLRFNAATSLARFLACGLRPARAALSIVSESPVRSESSRNWRLLSHDYGVLRRWIADDLLLRAVPPK